MTTSCQGLTEWTKLELCIACRKSSEMVARVVRSTGNESWHQTLAEIVEGEVAKRSPVWRLFDQLERSWKLREDKARWFRIRREVELAKCGFSKDCEGYRVGSVERTRYARRTKCAVARPCIQLAHVGVPHSKTNAPSPLPSTADK